MSEENLDVDYPAIVRDIRHILNTIPAPEEDCVGRLA
jgi:hypothetical protein